MAKRTVDAARPSPCRHPKTSRSCSRMGQRRLEAQCCATRRRASLRPRATSVVSPAAGLFIPIDNLADGSHLRSRRRARPCWRHGGPVTIRRHSAELHCRRRRTRHNETTHRMVGGQTDMPALPSGVRGAVITGWGTALGPKTLTNKDLEQMMDTSDEWIVERTGIRERTSAATTVGMSRSRACCARHVRRRHLRDRRRRVGVVHARHAVG